MATTSTDKRQRAVVAARLSYGHQLRAAGDLWYTRDRAPDRFVQKNAKEARGPLELGY
jgi:hypothetical protein